METKKRLRFILSYFKIKKDNYYFNYANLAKVPKTILRETDKFNSIFAYGSTFAKKVEKYQNEVRSHLSSVYGGIAENWFFLGPVSSVVSNILLQIIRDYKKREKRIPSISTYKMNFPSLILPVKSLESENLCSFNLIEYPEKVVDKNWCEEKIKSDIFLMSLVDFFNGFTHDLDLIYSHCQSKGIKLIVDFSQFPYWGILNVNNYPGVIFTSVLHKWLLGYPGHTISYIDLDTMPFFQGWRNMNNLFDYNIENFLKSHEISNRSPLPFCSFEGAFKLASNVGFDKINRYIKSSSNFLLEKLEQIGKKHEKFKIINNVENFKNHKSSIIAISVGSKTKELLTYLYNNNIIASYFPIDLIRFSTSFITTKEEIEFLSKNIEHWCNDNLIYEKETNNA